MKKIIFGCRACTPGLRWTLRTPRSIDWTPNWDNDLHSHFILSLVTLPPVRPMSAPGFAHPS